MLRAGDRRWRRGTAANLAGSGAVVLPPLNLRLIIDLFLQPAVLRLFEAQRTVLLISSPALSQILQRISELACGLPTIEHLEIDPLIGDSRQVFAVGVRVRVRPATAENWHYAHMAICPYPLTLESSFTTRGGVGCTIRPLRPEDALAFQHFVRGLSSASRYMRFFSSVSENDGMVGMMDALGFSVSMTDDPEIMDLSLRL